MSARLRQIGWKPFLALAAGVGSFSLLLYFYLSQRHVEYNFREVRGHFHTIDRNYHRLNYEILRSSLFAYSNQDEITGDLNTLKDEYEALRKNAFLERSAYRRSHRSLVRLGEALNRYESMLDDFMMLNAGIKNSFVYITSLSADKVKMFENDPMTYARILSVIAEVSQARILFDATFLHDLNREVEPLGELSGMSKAQAALIRSFMLHVHYIAANYPGFVQNVNRIETFNLDQRIVELETNFLDEAKRDYEMLDRFVVILAALFLTALVLVMGLLIRAGNENRRLRELEGELRHAISHDQLTELLSRSRFEQLQEQFEAPYLLLLNLDRFKHVNDFYGSAAGNAILKEIALLIRQPVLEPFHPYYFRLGGDEFGVVLQGIDADRARQMGRMLKKSIEGYTFFVDDIEVYLTVSVAVNGVAPLLENADLILKYDKARHSEGVLFFSEELHLKEQAARNIATAHELKRALDRDAIVPWFQPIVQLQSGEVAKYEALVRMVGSDGSVSGPAAFLETAMQTPYYRRITEVMVHKVFEAMEGYDTRFSINLGMRDLADEKMVSMLLSLLETYKERAGRLDIELLESEELDDLEAVKTFIKQVKAYGCRIAIDDFGIGYSNFAYLMELDIDILKIDGSLITKVVDDEMTQRTVRTIVRFAKQLGFEIVAEFVENEETIAVLRRMGVGYGQGYHFGRPAAAPEESTSISRS
ncbi:EAL domain-containing protein [Sulfurimonas sp. HSL-3221]|uniref:EAL domain-containing protein n=1 Tax=Sulfurimonadaceae TaxID=2771471 RepID=UPI001E5F3140|nr:EAL domain-containing protein [Sulfurimonas sp. HSL-3221]UFS62432.1 EAL domain-containing protein [Sulfurimonas sp. HSL-3221]